MRKRKPVTLVLVLVELGAQWPSWAQTLAGRGGRRVVAQAEGESPAAFSDRVAETLSTLSARGVPLSVAALACNERGDDAAMAARSKMASALLTALVRKRPEQARLYLSVSGRNERVHGALVALVSELGKSFGLPSERLRVRHADETPRSRESEVPRRVRIAKVA